MDINVYFQRWLREYIMIHHDPVIIEYSWVYKYLKAFFRDNYLVFIIQLYFLSGRVHTFNIFLDNLKVNEIVNDTNRFLLDNHIKQLMYLIEYYKSSFPDLQNLEILWDMHIGLVSKVLVTTSSWSSIYYEWVTSESTIREIFVWFNDFFNNNLPKFHPYEQLVKREYINTNLKAVTQTQVKNYFFQIWELIPYFLAIKAYDLNYENVLANIPYPVFFDYECAFLPELKASFGEYNMNFTWICSDDEQDDFSVLMWANKTRISYLIPILHYDELNPKITWTVPSKKQPIHTPIFNWVAVFSPNYLQELLLGYESSQKHLTNNKYKLWDKISRWDFRVRIILRPTRVYAGLIKKIMLQLSVDPQSSITKTVLHYFNFHQIPYLWEFGEILVNYEIDCLKKWIIPYFYVNIRDKIVYSSDGIVVWSLEKTPYELWSKFYTNIEDFWASQKQLLINQLKESI